jgi:magnesium transporter
VLTFQEHPGDCLDPVRDRIRKATGRIRTQGPDYLVYAILDTVIDSYFPILEEFGERLEALEEDVLRNPGPEVVSRIYAAKRDLLALRRAVWPQRESVNWLSREPCAIIQENTRLYFRDSCDHIAQIMDMVETFRELALGLVEGYQSSMSNRMNEVMKVLTIIATIFIPLGFLAGVWGMNFNAEKSFWNMPLLSQPWGYRFALGLMLAIGLTMLALFWRKGWLGSSPAPDRSED